MARAGINISIMDKTESWESGGKELRWALRVRKKIPAHRLLIHIAPAVIGVTPISWTRSTVEMLREEVIEWWIDGYTDHGRYGVQPADPEVQAVSLSKTTPQT